MATDVLVLNRNYYAIQVVSWKKAMSLMYQELATAIDENYTDFPFEDWIELSKLMKEHPNGFVHTPKFKIAIPDIIRLSKYDRLPVRDVKFNRRNIYQHYNNKCCYCDKKFDTKNLNLDHVLPKSRGGRTDWTNIVTSCVGCNTKKGDKTPQEASMKLLVKPSKPRWKGAQSFLEHIPKLRFKRSWQKIIDTAYWDGELQKR